MRPRGRRDVDIIVPTNQSEAVRRRRAAANLLERVRKNDPSDRAGKTFAYFRKRLRDAEGEKKLKAVPAKYAHSDKRLRDCGAPWPVVAA